MGSSTIRSATDATLELRSVRSAAGILRDTIHTEWREADHADLVTALRRHPPLLQERSLLLDLAIEEYREVRKVQTNFDLESHCQRFEEFGNSVHKSITRQLETQRYFDEHPELVEALYSPNWPSEGDDIGNFRVIEELGKGGAARVYLCTEHDIGDRQVVVKLTPRASFEATILGKLNHPNIVQILSTGYVEDRSLYYVCMPYRGRDTLGDFLDIATNGKQLRLKASVLDLLAEASPQSSPTYSVWKRIVAPFGRNYVGGVLEIAIGIADALQHAHSKKVLHGDLKPSNVLLTPSGQPQLLDFNLSQDFATSRIACGGTLPYMPPEHLRIIAEHEAPPLPRTFEPRPDIYSFGALLFELLSGAPPTIVPPNQNDVAAVATDLLTRLRQNPPPRIYNPLVSRRLGILVARCMSFDPARRPATMAEIRQILQAEQRLIPRFLRSARIRPFVYSLLATLSVGVVAAAATYVVTLPPRHLSHFEQGVAASASGQLNEAAEHFVSAIRLEPGYFPARFALGRARISQGRFDDAVSEFGELALKRSDATSMAYIGYCFNLKSISTAAIPWYERAIDHGATSVEVLNNLGASHISSRNTMPRAQQLHVAEQLLQRAFVTGNGHDVVRLNLVRLAVAKAAIDDEYDPSLMWQHARTLLEERPDSSAVRIYLSTWYHVVTQRQSKFENCSKIAQFATVDPEGKQLFQKLAVGLGGIPHQAAGNLRAEAQSTAGIAFHEFFIEPISLINRNPRLANELSLNNF